MDRNMRSNFVNSGPRSLPHMNSAKRLPSNNRLSPPAPPHNAPSPHNAPLSHNSNNFHNSHNSHPHNMHNPHNSHNSHFTLSGNNNNNNNNYNHTSQHDDLIHYIYDSWNKVSRDVERGGDDTRYFQEPTRHIANFTPLNLDEWWARRFVQTMNRKHRS